MLAANADELELDPDAPRELVAHRRGADLWFDRLATAAASVALVIIVATIVFLVAESRTALRSSGVIRFFTRSVWNGAEGTFGVFGLLMGTIIIAAIAMVVALPLSIAMAIFIVEYAPPRVARSLTGAVDLLAALPSLLFGMWGRDALQGRLRPVAVWFSDHLVAIPFFNIDDGAVLARSSFVAGIVVAFMITPTITSISRDVMQQVPRDLCEGALGLGATRWAMLRTVTLPFARRGILGATLLAFGRALGETIAVAIIVSISIKVNTHVLEEGAGSIAAQIATRFGEASDVERSGLVAAGLALMLLSLAVSLFARRIVDRSSPS